MGIFMRQDAQIGSTRSTLVGFVDNTALASAMETGAAHIADDLNNIRSVVHQIVSLQGGNWYDDIATPATFTGEGEVQRGVNLLNTDLHELERKRILRKRLNLTDISVGAGNNFVVLNTGELPGNTTAAVGAVNTLGTVVAAHGGTFGTHALTEVAGSSAISPKNLLEIVNASTRDPILSSGRVIYGLLQGESGVTDGSTITDTTTNRVQISFVRINATGDDLEAVPVADIESTAVNYCYVERVALDDLTEEDFLRGAGTDVPAAGTVDRQTVYDNQGVTPVDLVTNAVLDLEGAGVTWEIRDDLEARLFALIEGSAGGTSEMHIAAGVDLYDNDAIDVDFASGISARSGGTRPIDVGVTDGVVESTAGDLELQAFAELLLDDGNRSGSTFSVPLKITETSAEWDDLETLFGEVSLAAMLLAVDGSRTRVDATFTADVVANNDINGPGTPHSNVDVDLVPYDGAGIGSLEVYFNGELINLTDHYVAGGTPTEGDLQLTFDTLGTGSDPDTLTVIRNGTN